MNNYIMLGDNTMVPKLGQGTWFMGENIRKEKDEIASLRVGVELGMTLIDTAEMYGNGGAEYLIGKSIKEINRDKLFIVSKVYPHNAGRKNIFTSCDNTLKRLGTDYLDLYLLHWRGSIPLKETIECLEELITKGKIRRWGVSNFDTSDMKELWSVPNGSNCAVNQVLYHLGSRGIEYDLMPWMMEHKVPVMAYCPLAQAGTLRNGLLRSKSVQTVAKNHGITPMQVLLSFVLQHDNVIAIPKSGTPVHTQENAKALNIIFTEEEWTLLNVEYPKPKQKMFLDMV